jgi:hypothetical protein
MATFGTSATENNTEILRLYVGLITSYLVYTGKVLFIPFEFAYYLRKQCLNKLIPTLSSADSLSLTAFKQVSR